jgi:hypothetical protein
MNAPMNAPNAGDVPVAVVDIDGVLADVRHRLPHLDIRPPDWASFFATMGDDPPLPEGQAVAAELARGHRIIYVTGRPARYADVTARWLKAHGLPDGEIICRPDGDRRPAHVLKLAVVAEIARRSRVALCVDDNHKVLEALRGGGFAVFEADWAVGTVDLLEAQQSGRT